MDIDVRLPRRWIAAALSAAMLLGACSSSSTDESSGDAPSELALDTEALDTEQAAEDEALVEEEPEVADDLPPTEFTPEMFEELKADEVARAAVVQEMQGQGLEADQAECFIDNVSPGLFSTFSSGVQPNDEQFGELLELLEICEIAFGPES